MIETLQRLNPAIKARRQRGWVFAVPIATCAIGASVWAPSIFGSDDPTLLLMPILLGIIGLISLNKWVIRGQQQLIMPHLAKAVHLDYQQDAKTFLNELPPRLLPRANVRTAEDCISGTIGGRQMKLAEVKIATGGKRSRTLFRGFVLRFQNATALPAFFIAPKQKTGGWFSRIDVTDLIEAHTIIGQKGEVYGVWLSEKGVTKQDPTLTAVLDILTNLETQIGVNASLFSATSTGEEMHIALTHNRDLFRIGGLLANQSQITDSVKAALEELNIPLRIVSILLEAERQAEQIKQSQPPR